MNADSSVGLLGFTALVLVYALYSAGHSALINVRKQPLREAAEGGDKRAQRVLTVAEDATRLLSSRQFINTVVPYVAAGLLTLYAAGPVSKTLQSLGISAEQSLWVAYPLVWVIGALMMLIFGELIPSALASTRPDSLARTLVDPILFVMTVLSPFTRIIRWLTSGLVNAFGGQDRTPYVTEEEIKTLVDAGSEEGVIEDDEKEMIYSVFQFNDRVAREIMVPRIDIVGIEAESNLRQALDLVVSEGHSRIPIYEDTVDRIIGLLYAKDLLILWRDGSRFERKVREIMRPAYFVPESKKASSLLEDLQQRKIQLAIVVDEYGGTAGLITIEDLVEEIVGEIQDEYDPEEEADYEKLGEEEYIFDAGINLDDVNDLLSVALPDDESDTLGGYIFRVLDRVPLGGETFQAHGLEMKVEMVTGRRIRKVRVKRIVLPAAESEEKSKIDTKPDAKSESRQTKELSSEQLPGNPNHKAD